jgi:hypothetical protein
MMPIDTAKLRKAADALDCLNAVQVEMHGGAAAKILKCPDIGDVNVLIREVTEQLLTWQNVSKETAQHLVDAAYECGK